MPDKKYNINKVVASLRKNSKFADQAVEQKRLLIKYAQQSLVELSDILDQPATPKTIINAKIIWMRFLIRSDFARQSVSALLRHYKLTMLSQQQAIQLVESSNRAIVSFLIYSRDNFDEFLRKNSITVEAWLVSPYGANLSKKVMKLYRAGKLTIGRLLELQSDVILMNTPKGNLE